MSPRKTKVESQEPPFAHQLSWVLAQIDNVDVMRAFVRDVMTESEIREISARLEAARLLRLGTRYTEVISATELSSRTVARVSHWLHEGKGGYAAALELLESLEGPAHSSKTAAASQQNSGKR